MKLPDTNVWLALSLSKHTHHRAAVEWLEEQDSPDEIAFCRSTQQSFLRLLTTTGVMSAYGIAALSNKDAWAVYEAFIADDRILFQVEPPGLNPNWKKLAARRTSSPKLWMDAYLAAFAIASGAELVTTDKAFSQFPGLDVTIIEVV
ncbi:MAG: type II toxin-antitoxin system VapC family toxin [Prosthecobacter sp.]|jgi:toxin-antitoxin system PIN domain toxin|uniref:type II toxin-antitoxin system VapC family toxin n=1 Tax=Prosthecobacter sp. TaxID=1965333 RepID=UPI0019D95F30|nr:type II toxin-antitoxin system VapC family toxin [Prosthecobacter sp.]MBE2283359.1 type II toxin-antitoxin system VapC family toxin [Prosthecobacter sp.]